MTLLELASDPSTPADVLDAFAKDYGDDIRRAVARNPNTSKAILSYLFEAFPAEVLANPAVELYEIEEPGLQWISFESRKFVAWNKMETIEIANKLADDSNPKVRTIVATNAKTPQDILDRLANDQDAKVRYRVARNASARVDTIEKLLGDKDPTVKWAATKRLLER